MEKLELLSRIEKLSLLLHSDDLAKYNLANESIIEIKRVLDELSETYITTYC
ncbi:hypothetical protein [Pelosinus propionicus]|uniref:Uncharacterized protein n=1 Tax=Pelosinus propionicus DSM 13327 TaxID=1123291 RepID=A0A1I4GTT9_9FIRM|nr:hypothetical protein [Pelosinus propionicus]SFL33375.1 hypothetical protein SAMN04490355_1001208 [Pelosinus propionicus DSM 13327]